MLFDITEDLFFGEGRELFYLSGTNGVGKTSFLEKILLPTLQRHKLPYLYLGQDMHIQLYTIKASLAITGQKIFALNENQILELWIRQGDNATVFILDEFDKYYPDYRLIFDSSKTFIQTYFLVTHNDIKLSEVFPDHFSLYKILFDLIESDAHNKRVRLTKEKIW